jgi:hypothetical protein
MFRVSVIELSKEQTKISVPESKKLLIDFYVEVEIFDKSPSIII